MSFTKKLIYFRSLNPYRFSISYQSSENEVNGYSFDDENDCWFWFDDEVTLDYFEEEIVESDFSLEFKLFCLDREFTLLTVIENDDSLLNYIKDKFGVKIKK